MDGCIVCNSIDQLLSIIKYFSSNDITVIGGGFIFRQLLPYCSTAYITKMQFDGNADTFMPNLDEVNSWQIKNESNYSDYNGIKYSFVEYLNNSVRQLKFSSLNTNMSSYFENKNYIDIDFINYGEDETNYTEESYLVELRDLLHAYFRPIEFSFNSTDILHFIEESNYLSYSLEEYFRYKRYIASNEDFKQLFKKYNPNKEVNFSAIRIKKEELDSFENCIDSFIPIERIIEKYKI